MSKELYWSIFIDSLPIMIGATFQTTIFTINIHYATTNEMMAGIGLAAVLVHCLGGSLILGFNAGFTNFASRAFGAKNKQRYYQYFIQGFLNLVGLLTFFLFVGMMSYRLAIATGQQEDISLYSYKTIMYLMPGLVCFYTSDFLRNSLNSQLVFKPILYVFAFCIGAHVVFSMIISTTYGFEGILISTNLTFLTLLICMVFLERKYSTYKISSEILSVEDKFHENKEFILECFYVAMPYCLDLFMYEFMTLYLGSFKIVEQIAAHVALSNVCTLMIAPYIGYSFCTMTKIGNYIGQNKPKAIIELIRASTILSQVSIYLLQLLALLFKQQLANFFTDQEQVRQHIYSIIYLYTIQYFFDSLQFMGTHTFKSLGMGSWVMKVMFVSFYLIASTSMIVLCQFMESKILGVWIGFTIGDIVLAALLVKKYTEINIYEITEDLHLKVKKNEDLAVELLPVQ